MVRRPTSRRNSVFGDSPVVEVYATMLFKTDNAYAEALATADEDEVREAMRKA